MTSLSHCLYMYIAYWRAAGVTSTVQTAAATFQNLVLLQVEAQRDMDVI